MSDAQMWSLVVGTLAPVVVSVIQQPRWSSAVRAVVTAVVCLLLGWGTAAFAGDLSGRTLVSSFLTILVAAFATYRNFWRPTGIAPSIEAATSPKARGGSTPDA